MVQVAPTLSAAKRTLQVLVLSPHRLVPLALGAAGRTQKAFEICASATDADEALVILAEHGADVLVFDPTAMSLGKIPGFLAAAAAFLRHHNSVCLLLEPAQSATTVAARFAWAEGVRCAMTSLDDPEFWPVTVNAAVRGATYVSPVATELFELSNSLMSSYCVVEARRGSAVCADSPRPLELAC